MSVEERLVITLSFSDKMILRPKMIAFWPRSQEGLFLVKKKALLQIEALSGHKWY